MFIKLLIISVICISIVLVGLGIRLLLKSGGRFPETHISNNKEMQKRGIACAQKTDIGRNATGQTEKCETCGSIRF